MGVRTRYQCIFKVPFHLFEQFNYIAQLNVLLLRQTMCSSVMAYYLVVNYGLSHLDLLVCNLPIFYIFLLD